MKFRRGLVILFLTLGSALQPRAQEQKPVVSLRIDTNLVSLDLTVTDQNGNYVRDLRPEEVQLFEDGKPIRIDFFNQVDTADFTRPLAVVFALDTSGSLRPEESITLRQAAAKFTQLMQGESVFAALTFNNKVKVVQEFTHDPRKLAKALEKTIHFEGSTRIYDAIDRAIVMLEKEAPRLRKGRPVRRVVIVISDGFDSASIIDRREMIRRANLAGVTVYTITLPSYMLSATRAGERVITPLDATRIVSNTGGKDFAADADDFSPVFKALAEEIRASYALAYYPEWRDGKRHDLRVEVSRPGMRLRINRTGFQAPEK